MVSKLSFGWDGSKWGISSKWRRDVTRLLNRVNQFPHLGRGQRVVKRVGGAVGAIYDSEMTTNELLRLAVELGPIGIFDIDHQRKRTWYSQKLFSILGLRPGTQLDYSDALKFVDERYRIALTEKRHEAESASREGAWSSIHRVARADGDTTWVSVHGRQYYRSTANERQAVRSIGTVLDITQLKASESELRQNELRLRLALDAAQIGTFEIDIGGTEAVIDAQEALLLGLSRETRVVPTNELRSRLPMEELQASDAKRERLELYNEDYRHEIRFTLPDGTERWLAAYAAIRENRIFGVNFDITPRKRAELALRESEARLRVAVSGAALGVFEWDVKKDVAVWENDRMYEIFGLMRADRTLGKHQLLKQYLHPDHIRSFQAELKKAMRTGKSLHTVCQIRPKGSVPRWLQLDGKFEFSKMGERTRLVGVVADITERRTLQREKEQLAESLITLQEQERQRIAQELHDSTAQHLTAASLTLMSLRSQLVSAGDAATRWDEVERSIHEALKELRTFSYLLHSPVLQREGLRSTLRQYVEGFARRSGLIIKLRASANADKLPRKIQRSLFRIAQEALANVHRHASASHVSVDLRRIADCFHLVITDDGCGMADTPEDALGVSSGAGVGLYGMRVRARQFGGELKIRTGPHGTRIQVVVPTIMVAR
jgi:PAS domain S-box-containing protein